MFSLIRSCVIHPRSSALSPPKREGSGCLVERCDLDCEDASARLVRSSSRTACPAAMVIEFSVRVTLACSREDSAVALSVSKVVMIS